MHFKSLRQLALVALPLLASARPKASEGGIKNVLEKKPWVLTDIIVFTARPSSPGASYIDFGFADPNDKIQIKTQCRRTVLPGDRGSLHDPATYYPCQNRSVAFTFDNGRFDLQRTYYDAAVGGNGYVTAFGHKKAKFATSRLYCGARQVDEKLEIPVTSMIA